MEIIFFLLILISMCICFGVRKVAALILVLTGLGIACIFLLFVTH